MYRITIEDMKKGKVVADKKVNSLLICGSDDGDTFATTYCHQTEDFVNSIIAAQTMLDELLKEPMLKMLVELKKSLASDSLKNFETVNQADVDAEFKKIIGDGEAFKC